MDRLWRLWERIGIAMGFVPVGVFILPTPVDGPVVQLNIQGRDGQGDSIVLFPGDSAELRTDGMLVLALDFPDEEAAAQFADERGAGNE